MAPDSAILRKFRCAVNLTPADESAILGLLANQKRLNAGQHVSDDGPDNNRLAYVILEGWCLRSRGFADGRRQISRVFVPGDFMGVNGTLHDSRGQNVVALTKAVVGVFDTARVSEQLRAFPKLLYAALWSYSRDAAIMEERITSIGRRSAYERLAHFIIELYVRLEAVGEAFGDRFAMPLTQEHLADLLGLTSVHVNRILKRLRTDGLVSISGKTVTILEKARLIEIADFNPQYLLRAPAPGEESRWDDIS